MIFEEFLKQENATIVGNSSAFFSTYEEAKDFQWRATENNIQTIIFEDVVISPDLLAKGKIRYFVQELRSEDA